MKPILAVESVGKAFGRKVVLSAAGLWAAPGRISAILGRNGCGKTTLLRVACGLLKPDYGIVIFRGRRLLRPKLWQLARDGLFFVPERSLLHSTVTCGAHFDALVHHYPDARVKDAVDRLRLADLLGRTPRQLSGGERRRVELGLALARRPACLLVDEPFHSISPTDGELLQRAFRALAASGSAVVITGHEVNLLLETADEVVWHTAGTTHVLGPPAEARRHDQLRREYLADLSVR